MNPLSNKSSLSHPRQRVIELLQTFAFGKIELLIRESEPIIPPRRVVETRKMGTPSGPRAESDLQDFYLKQQVIDLFQTMDEIRNGILSVTVRHGLPCLVEAERTDGQ